ncbi:type 1 glutamine amidotransferase [Leifsonia virtsii]|uniref:Type 1 glutamine amidotransferase n=1 Tax=Leifsonia virtsii TaxID=3035915 RepID=A0ABT8IV48_9MICO|nr:type 1 glutamine amidotransferase [Leifsonia virtsii]MDN4596688.1 type 1 glutamine amidotransferase [Leifsonia virtsii]
MVVLNCELEAVDEIDERVGHMVEPGAARRVILIIQPDEKDDLGRMAPWLAEDGFELRTIRPYLGETVPAQVDADALLVLGGSMAATDDHLHPWLLDVRELLRDALARSVPTLGVCLGAQLLALAAGGTVQRGRAGLECGVVEVRWLDAGRSDPLVSSLGQRFSAATMHYDVIDRLPSNAALLGTGMAYAHQVFRVGDAAWGVQFHPEVTPERFAAWRTETSPAERAGYDRQAQRVAESDKLLVSSARALTLRFGHIIRGRNAGGVRLG